jgi:hypothetical protein
MGRQSSVGRLSQRKAAVGKPADHHTVVVTRRLDSNGASQAAIGSKDRDPIQIGIVDLNCVTNTRRDVTHE